MGLKTMTYPCVCCGFLTRTEPSNGDYDICPICFWKDDPIQNDQPDADGGANSITLHQARLNFKKFGASEQRFIKNVRAPDKTEYPI
ncbi:unnamed protein product [Commensalibacter communis]|nr:unnamed protein product [Commensalibacter communis]CAI3956508.1 unnamed protein product [Commensalibacter communis]